jgi:hypothetical protein
MEDINSAKQAQDEKLEERLAEARIMSYGIAVSFFTVLLLLVILMYTSQLNTAYTYLCDKYGECTPTPERSAGYGYGFTW